MKATLLIADGDAELCDLYQGFLSTYGYEVTTAADGLGCLAKLRQAPPAALLLDLELCWGGGDGVLAWLREEGAEPAVPVIVTATAGSAPPALHPPVVGFLPKPFALKALLESVRAAVGQERREGAGDRRAPLPAPSFSSVEQEERPMTPSVARLPPPREPTPEERDPTPPAALPTQAPEDLRLADGVARALGATGYGALRGIEVAVRARVVVLRGRVPSYHLKQVAQAAALAVAGPHQVCNDLEVGRPI